MSAIYNVGLYQDGSSRGIDDRPTAIEWNRRLDEISTATITYALPSVQCCEQLGLAEPWANEIGIWRDGRLQWWGWITEVVYSRDAVVIMAADALVWLSNRLLSADLSVTGIDYADVFESVWLDAVGSTGDVSVELAKTATGVATTKDYLAANYQTAWDIAIELFGTAVDATALGQRVYFGDLSFLKRIELGLQDIEGDVALRKSGFMYGNRWTIKGTDDVVSTVTNATPAPYPVVDRVWEDQNIITTGDATAAGNSRLEFSRIVPRLVEFPGDARLKICDGDRLNELVPGTQVNFDSTGLCIAQKQTLRLQDVNVSVSGEEEAVSLLLQPLGEDPALI